MSTDNAGTLLNWQIGAVSLVGTALSASALRRAGLTLDDAPQHTVRYRIDADGSFAGIENAAELRASALQGLEFVADVLPDDGTFEALYELYASMSDDEIAVPLGEELMLYHGLDGMALTAGDSLWLDDLLPNALGGEPFPATTELAVNTLHGEGGCAEVVAVTTVDSEEFARIMRDTVEDAFGEPVDEADLLNAFSVRAEITALVEVPSGAVMRVAAVQAVTAMGETGAETITITRTS